MCVFVCVICWMILAELCMFITLSLGWYCLFRHRFLLCAHIKIYDTHAFKCSHCERLTLISGLWWNFKITRTYSHRHQFDISNFTFRTRRTMNEAINLVMVDCSNQADKSIYMSHDSSRTKIRTDICPFFCCTVWKHVFALVFFFEKKKTSLTSRRSAKNIN